jgi:hypothetical protein
MPVKNNDDVSHLLDAIGPAGSPYREFENRSDHLHAPLIEAVFASGPPEGSADPSQGIGGARSDLLSEVFDAPKPPEKPEVRVAAVPTDPRPAIDIRAEAPVHRPSPALAGRSLSDIRRIISRPVAEAPDASPPDSLHGVFDRLAN